MVSSPYSQTNLEVDVVLDRTWTNLEDNFKQFLHISLQMEESIRSDLDTVTLKNPNESHH